MDLYQQLGVARGANEAEIKKAYRSLAKQLHPDRNKDNPKAAERFAAVTRAYDILSDKDKRGRYDRGEIDEDGNPRSPFGSGYGRSEYSRSAGRSAAGGNGGFEGYPGPGGGFGDAADLSDLFEGLFGGGGGGGQRRGSGFGGFRQQRASAKGADVNYRLKVPFIDAVTLKEQRVTLSGGRTIDLKLPKGVDTGTKVRLAGQGDEGPAGKGDAIVSIEIAAHPFYVRDGNNIRLTLPITLKEAVLGGKVKVPTPEGPVMLSIPKGSSSGKLLRIKGRAFIGRDGQRGDLIIELAIDLPQGNEALERFAQGWDSGGNPRASLGV